MSSVEDRSFVINYRILKEIDNARKRGVVLEDIDGALAYISTNFLNLREEIENDYVDLGEIQEMLIGYAAAVIMLAIDLPDILEESAGKPLKCATG